MAQKTKTPPKTDQPAKEVAPLTGIEFKLISTDLIDDPERPMRSEMSPASVEDLVVSIKQVGIIEPLVVKVSNGRYEVIAGHRRLYASKLAKVPEVPCYVRVADKEQTEMLKIHENLYRAEVKPADEAKHYDYLIQKQKMSPVKISQLISRSLSYVTDRLAILEYPDFLKEAMDNQEISFSVAREFARFDDLKQMRTAVYYAKRGGMTQEMARKWVQDYYRTKDNSTLQTTPSVNPINGQQEVQHTATCVYCREQVTLIEAAIVYMHNMCLENANKVQLSPETQPLSQ